MIAIRAFSALGPVTAVSASFSGMTDYNCDASPQPATPLSGSQDIGNGTLKLNGLSGDTTTLSHWGYCPIDGRQLCLLFLEAVSK
jgi:hypothetical protein